MLVTRPKLVLKKLYHIYGSFLSVVQTPGAPKLEITLTSTNTIVISWPARSGGWELQRNAGLNTTNWVPAIETVSDNGTNRFIVTSPLIGSRFFRLFNP